MASLATDTGFTMDTNDDNQNQSKQLGNSKPVILDNKVAFKFMVLNILGHDFMHDFILNTTRTAKNKKIINSITTTLNSLGKILTKNKTISTIRSFIEGIKKNKKGGGKTKPLIENNLFYRKDVRQSMRQDEINYRKYTNYKFSERELIDYINSIYGSNAIIFNNGGYEYGGKEGEMEEILKDIEASIIDGRMDKEEARMLLEDMKATLEIEDACEDIADKGQALTVIATLLKLV